MSTIDIKIILWYLYEPMQYIRSAFSQHQATIQGLAVVGFIALIVLGLWLAIYSARFVPATVNRLGAAAVSLSQIFVPEKVPAITVIPFAQDNTVPSSITVPSTTEAAVPIPPAPAKTVPGAKSNITVPMGSTTPTVLSGLPDLTVHIDAIGYLASSTPDSFVATSTVPTGSRPAVKFTIKNIGTNVAGPWRFSASIPTQTQFIYQSAPQQPLNPGDRIEYTLGFDQANKGIDKMISITANFDRAITESNYDNNSNSATVTILGN